MQLEQGLAQLRTYQQRRETAVDRIEQAVRVGWNPERHDVRLFERYDGLITALIEGRE